MELYSRNDYPELKWMFYATRITITQMYQFQILSCLFPYRARIRFIIHMATHEKFQTALENIYT